MDFKTLFKKRNQKHEAADQVLELNTQRTGVAIVGKPKDRIWIKIIYQEERQILNAK